MQGELKQVPEEFEQRCKECCTSIEKDVKRQAELQVNQAVASMSMADLEIIIQGASQMTLFVVSQYLYQNLGTQQDYKGLLQLAVGSLLRWRSSINSFTRNGVSLQQYAFKSFTRLIGEVMKCIFSSDSDSKAWLYELINATDSEGRLLLWTYMIHSVSEMDAKMGFLAYRNMSYSFQDDGIFHIMKTVLPYFNRLAEGVKFNELTMLQSNLTVDDNAPPRPLQVLAFSSEELELASLVIELLRSVVTYVFNVTYSEFEMESSYENAAICFPQRLKEILSGGDFYESLFYLSERFLQERPADELLMKCLQSLQKIVLCRLSFEKKELRRSFIHQSIKGITRLMALTESTELFQEFMEFNRKMLNNFSLKKFRKCEPYFTEWLRHLERHFVKLALQERFVFDNLQLRESLELLVKVVEGSTNFKMAEYLPLIKGLAQNVLWRFLERALRCNIDMMEDVSLRKMKHLRSLSSEMFSPLRVLFCIDFAENCRRLAEVELDLFKKCVNGGGNFNDVTNFLLLLLELSLPEVVNMNLYKESVKPTELPLFARLYGVAFDFIKLYRAAEQTSSRYLNMAVLFVYDKLLTQVLESLDVRCDKPKPMIATTNRLFLAIRGRSAGESEMVDEFLLECFQVILSYMRSKDRLQVDYSMECLSGCLLKLKWGVRRDMFKDMEMPQVIINYCVSVAKEEFREQPFLKCRINLFKIITVAGFDDCLDNYREKLKYVFDAMHLNPTNQNYQILIYDLRGISNQIDARPVYRFFLKRVMPTVRLLFTEYLLDPRQLCNPELVRQALKLCRTLLENKAQRLTLTMTAPVSYELVGVLLPYMLRILIELNRQSEHNFEAQIPIAAQLFRSFNEVMKGGYINFFLLLSLGRANTQSYLQELMKYLQSSYRAVMNYPKVFEHYLLTCSYIAKELSELVFSLSSNEVVLVYCSIFNLAYKLTERLLREHLNGNAKNDKNLDHTVETMSASLSAVRMALQHTHKPINMASAELFKFSHYQEKMEMIVGLFLNVAQLKENTHLFNGVCKTLYLFTRLYPESMERVHNRFQALYVSGYNTEKLQALYRPINDRDFDSEEFSALVSQWINEIDNKAAARLLPDTTLMEY